MKIMSVFSALDGAHLDRSLFGAHVSGVKREGRYGQSKQTRFFDRRRFGERGQGNAQDRKRAERTTHPDAGLR
ncbi:MAG: hypothetical protein ABJF50_19745 [Paracoccaceae bacterium]